MGLPLASEVRDTEILRVYNPPEVVQSALDSLADAPVTRDHPSRFVTPETFAQVARGTVSAGSPAFNGTELSATLVIQDAALLAEIESGVRREISLGYRCLTAMEAGQTPDGESYDAIRSSMVVNHVAIVPRGRAGQKVCLALDSEWIPPQEPGDATMKLKVKGAEVSAEDAQAAVDAALVEANDALRAAEARAAVAEAKLSDVKALCDAKDAEIEALKAKTTEEAIDAIVEARAAKAAAAAEAEKRRSVVKARGIDVEGKPAEFIDAAYELIQKDDGSSLILGRAPAAPVNAADSAKPKAPKTSSRDRMKARLRAAK